MSSTFKQALVLAFGGLTFVFIVSRLARRRLLTTRYAFGWMGVGIAVTLAAAVMPFIGDVGRLADMSPTGVLLAVSTLILLAISVQLSISVSMLQERLRTMAETQALLARQLDDLAKEMP
jgi:hypothetical protein